MEKPNKPNAGSGRSTEKPQPIKNIGKIGTKLVSKLSKSELEKLIRALTSNSDRVVWTRHCDESLKKREISKSLALEVLQKGVIRSTPEPNLAKGSIECRMERYVAGIDCTVVAALQSDLTGGDRELMVIAVSAWK